jgi:rubrerythrin
MYKCHLLGEPIKKEGFSVSFIDRNKHQEDKKTIEEVIENSIEIEEDLMRTYLITAERIHDDDELKDRLENFAEGNAKRTKQLLDELDKDQKD